MATRPQQGGGSDGDSGPAAPSTHAAQTMYEDFKPTSSWQENNENHILTIDVRGFVMHQIKISTQNQNTFSVSGERPSGPNTRIRFQEDFQIPADSEMKTTDTKFERGNLIITIGKKNVDKPQETTPAKSIDTKIPQQHIRKQGQDEQPPAVQTSRLRDRKNLEPASGDPRMNRDQPEVVELTGGATRPSMFGTARPKRDQPEAVEHKGGAPSMFRTARRVIKQTHEGSDSGEKNAGEKMARREAKIPKRITESSEEYARAKVAGKEEKIISKRSKELPEAGTAKNTKLLTSDTSTAKENNEASKRQQKIHTDTGYGVSTMGSYKKAEERHTERQSLVNMGLVVVVIMVLSFYVMYQFATGKDTN